jgi:hypothetical protein
MKKARADDAFKRTKVHQLDLACEDATEHTQKEWEK